MDNLDCWPKCRIWVGWDSSRVDVHVRKVSLQAIHCWVSIGDNGQGFWCTFVYGVNDPNGRKDLWRDIGSFAMGVNHDPWVVLGDFNAIRFRHEKSGGSNIWKTHSDDLDLMCRDLEMDDIRGVGNFFTWSNRGEEGNRIWCKLDRVLVNEGWSQAFGNSEASFTPPGISDHCTVIVDCGIP